MSERIDVAEALDLTLKTPLAIREELDDCTTGKYDDLGKDGQPYFPTAGDFCPALLQRVLEEKGYEGLSNYFQGNPDAVNDALGMAYLQESGFLNSDSNNLPTEGLSLTNFDRVVALAAATRAAKNPASPPVRDALPTLGAEFLKEYGKDSRLDDFTVEQLADILSDRYQVKDVPDCAATLSQMYDGPPGFELRTKAAVAADTCLRQDKSLQR